MILTALVINLVRLASLSSRENALREQLAALDRQIEANQSEIDYRKTDEYVDAYAREYLGMIGEGEISFVTGGQ
ncbi:MAG: cell division protein FtsH [Clostridia bacterium]|nr:cell division protein FtsH [Clostridia bacterium]